MGRLISVVEDATGTIGCGPSASSNTGTNLTTSYTYFAADHLKAVTHGGRDRSFTYDSLGRLRTASNNGHYGSRPGRAAVETVLLEANQN